MRQYAVALLLLACLPAAAQAGMPTPRVVVNELVRLRLENVSFFLLAFLVSALLVQLLWNYLRCDWAALPRLTYFKALGLLTLWGLLFVLVLTMISGARELMTPAAWEPNGATYRLAGPDAAKQAGEELQERRRQQIEKLRDALWAYAREHGDHFPPARSDPAVPPELWQVPDPSGMPYFYLGGIVSAAPVPVAYEPGLFGPERLVLFSNGDIRKLTYERLLEALPPEKR
jgi:hypothetical protein